jgi:hypothetical protein
VIWSGAQRPRPHCCCTAHWTTRLQGAALTQQGASQWQTTCTVTQGAPTAYCEASMKVCIATTYDIQCTPCVAAALLELQRQKVQHACGCSYVPRPAGLSTLACCPSRSKRSSAVCASVGVRALSAVVLPAQHAGCWSLITERLHAAMQGHVQCVRSRISAMLRNEPYLCMSTQPKSDSLRAVFHCRY